MQPRGRPERLREIERAASNPLDVHITLSRIISLSEVARLAADNGLSIDTIYTRAIDSEGTRHTGMHRVTPAGQNLPGAGMPTDAEVVRSLSSVNNSGPRPPTGMSERPKVTYQGVTDFTARLPAGRYGTLASSSNVYLADVTRTLVRSELAQKLGRQPGNLVVNSKGGFWDLEETGVVPKPVARPSTVVPQ